MKNLNKIISIFTIIILFQFNSLSQDFAWQADINPILENSFYKINLNPEIISKMENGLNDIRIYDNDNSEIPYIFEKENLINRNDYFIEYKIISKEHQNYWPYHSRLIIHNPKKNAITSFYLIIKNSDVTKSLKLSGSDDKKHWYIIKDNYRFHSVFNNETTSEIEIMNFPNSNYKYFEILLDDWRNKPINILKVGYFDTSYEEGKFCKIKNPNLFQTEIKEEKQSFIKVQFDDNQLIDKVVFDINFDDFYLRRAEIQVKDSIQYKKKKTKIYYRTIKEITLSSNSSNKFYFDHFKVKVKEFYVRIHNKDDKALNIKQIDAFQLKNYLICKFKKNTQYNLKFGNKEIAKPQYDLEHFKQEISKNIPSIDTKNAVNIKEEIEQIDEGLKISKTYIWIAIIVVIAFLTYMTLNMLKDMKKSDE